MHVEPVNRIDDLSLYRVRWRELLDETPGATFFQSLEWLEVYWRHFGHKQRLRVLLVFQDDQLIGILPLVVRTERTKIGNLRFLTYPLDYWGSYYGPIGPAAGAVLDAGLEHIRNTKRDWDVLELRWIGRTQADCDLTQSAMQRHGFPEVQTLIDHTALIQFEGTWDDYLKDHTSKWRHNARRQLRQLEKHGHVEHIRYRPRGTAYGDGAPRWDLFDACQSVARHSWQSRSTDGTTLCHESIRDFLRDAHAAAASIGALDLNLLLLDNVPVAFTYNYRYKDSVYGLRMGFDAERSREGAGNILYGKIIEDSFRRGDRFYDLGPGSLGWKKGFTTSVQPIFQYSYFPRLAVRPQLLHLKRLLDAHGTVAAAF